MCELQAPFYAVKITISTFYDWGSWWIARYEESTLNYLNIYGHCCTTNPAWLGLTEEEPLEVEKPRPLGISCFLAPWSSNLHQRFRPLLDLGFVVLWISVKARRQGINHEAQIPLLLARIFKLLFPCPTQLVVLVSQAGLPEHKAAGLLLIIRKKKGCVFIFFFSLRK